MTPQTGIANFANSGTFVTMASNGYIASPLRVARSGRYELELVASGSVAMYMYPEVDIRVDDRSLGKIQLSTDGWRSYRLPLDLPSGDHEPEAGLHQRLQSRW